MTSFPPPGPYSNPGASGAFSSGSPGPWNGGPGNGTQGAESAGRSRDLLTAGLLGLVSALLLGSSFLPLLTTDLGSGNGTGVNQMWVSAWGWGNNLGESGSDSIRLFGAVLAVPALMAAIAAALLLLGVTTRPRARAFISLATGSALGAAASVALGYGLYPLTEDNRGMHSSPGAGFWVLLVTAMLAIAALWSNTVSSAPSVALDPHGRPLRERVSGLDVTSGVLLMLATLLTVGGSIWMVFQTTGEALIFDDAQLNAGLLVLCAIAAFIAALLLFVGNRATVRKIGTVVAAVTFVTIVQVVLLEVDTQISLGDSARQMSFSFYVLMLAGLLALVVMVLTVIAAGSTPSYRTPYGTPPQPNPYQPPYGGGYGAPVYPPGGYAPAPQQGGYAPNVPYQGGYSPGAPPQGGYNPGAPQQGPYGQ